MNYDIFFSISQTPTEGQLPSEAQMFRNFLDQVEAADELNYETAWIAESHLSSQTQKRHAKPVIPHWEGEVGLNTNFLNLDALLPIRIDEELARDRRQQVVDRVRVDRLSHHAKGAAVATFRHDPIADEQRLEATLGAGVRVCDHVGQQPDRLHLAVAPTKIGRREHRHAVL